MEGPKANWKQESGDAAGWMGAVQVQVNIYHVTVCWCPFGFLVGARSNGIWADWPIGSVSKTRQFVTRAKTVAGKFWGQVDRYGGEGPGSACIQEGNQHQIQFVGERFGPGRVKDSA